MVKSKILSDAEALEERARQRQAENAALMQAIAGNGAATVELGGLFNRRIDWLTFTLAVIGAVVAICALGFLVLPGVIVGMGNLIAFSLKFWGVT